MEVPFLFFDGVDPFEWTDKSDKCKEPVHKKLSYKTKEEKWWSRQALVQIR